MIIGKFKVINVDIFNQFKREGYQCYLFGIAHRDWFFGFIVRTKI